MVMEWVGRMDNLKELNEILSGVLELPAELQDAVVEDIVESAKNRVATMKKIVG
jgi:hypothetical protein